MTTAISMYMIEEFIEPRYTINVYQQSTIDTYNVNNDEPKQEPKQEPKPKPKEVDKVEKTKEVKQTTGYSDSEMRILAQIINAEAKGEPFNGKVAVGNVILNRVESEEFPNTIKEVVYQPRQFQPVSNGAINNSPSDEAVKAARKAIETNLIGDALYFYNPDIATDSWIRTREVIMNIGNHSFAF